MTVEDLQRLAGLASAAAAAGCADAFAAAVGEPPDRYRRGDRRWASAWSDWDELWEQTSDVRGCSGESVTAFGKRIADRYAAGETRLGEDVCRRVWDLISLNHSPLQVAKALLERVPLAAEVAQHAVQQRWASSPELHQQFPAYAVVGGRTPAHIYPQIADLLCGVDVHTPTTLGLLFHAQVSPTAQFAELLADGKITIVSDGGTEALHTKHAYNATIAFVAAVSSAAEIAADVAHTALSQLEGVTGSFDVVLPGSWNAGDDDTTRRAADALHAFGENALLLNAAGQTHSWVVRAAADADDRDVAQFVAHLLPVGLCNVARETFRASGGDAETVAVLRRMFAAGGDHKDMLRTQQQEPDLSAALIAACVPGLAAHVAGAYITSTAVTHRLAARLVASTGGTADGFEVLAALIGDWSGTIDELCATVRRLRR